MATKLERLIDDLGDEDTLTVGTIRRLIRSDTSGGEVVRWVDAAEAATITGTPESTLRRNARQWLTMQEPSIHVRKRGKSKRARWEFREADCYAVARRTVDVEARLRPTPKPDAVDEREALLSHYANVATENL